MLLKQYNTDYLIQLNYYCPASSFLSKFPFLLSLLYFTISSTLTIVQVHISTSNEYMVLILHIYTFRFRVLSEYQKLHIFNM